MAIKPVVTLLVQGSIGNGQSLHHYDFPRSIAVEVPKAASGTIKKPPTVVEFEKQRNLVLVETPKYVSQVPLDSSFLQLRGTKRPMRSPYSRGKSNGISVSLEEDVEIATPLETVSGEPSEKETPSKKLIQKSTAQSEKYISDCTTHSQQRDSSLPALLSTIAQQMRRRLYCYCLGKKNFGQNKKNISAEDSNSSTSNSKEKTSNSNKETKNPMTEKQAIRTAQRLFVLWLVFFFIDYSVECAESFAIYYFESFKTASTNCMDLTLLSFRAFVFFFTAAVSKKWTAENIQKMWKELQSRGNMNGELQFPSMFRYYSAIVFTDSCALLSVFWVFYSSGAGFSESYIGPYGGGTISTKTATSASTNLNHDDAHRSLFEDESRLTADTISIINDHDESWVAMLSRSLFGQIIDCDGLVDSGHLNLNETFAASKQTAYEAVSSSGGRESTTIFDGAKIVGIVGTIVFFLEIWTMHHLWLADNIARISRKFACRGFHGEKETSEKLNSEKEKGNLNQKGKLVGHNGNHYHSSQNISENNSEGRNEATLSTGNEGTKSQTGNEATQRLSQTASANPSDIITKEELMMIAQMSKKWGPVLGLLCQRDEDGGSRRSRRKWLTRNWWARKWKWTHPRGPKSASSSVTLGEDSKSKFLPKVFNVESKSNSHDTSPATPTTLLSLILASRCEDLVSETLALTERTAQQREDEIKAAETALSRMFEISACEHCERPATERKKCGSGSSSSSTTVAGTNAGTKVVTNAAATKIQNGDVIVDEGAESEALRISSLRIEKFLTNAEALINKTRSDLVSHYCKHFVFMVLPQRILAQIPREILIILAPWFHEFFLSFFLESAVTGTNVNSSEDLVLVSVNLTKRLVTFLMFSLVFLAQCSSRRLEYLSMLKTAKVYGALNTLPFFARTANSVGLPMTTPLVPILLRGVFDFVTFMIKLVFYYVPSLSLEGHGTAFLMILVRSVIKLLLQLIGIVRWRAALWKRERAEKREQRVKSSKKLFISRILDGFLWTVDQIENVCGLFGGENKKTEKKMASKQGAALGNNTNHIARRLLVDIITKPLWPELLSASGNDCNKTCHSTDHNDNESDNDNRSKKREDLVSHTVEALLSVERTSRLLVEEIDRNSASVSTKKKNDSNSARSIKKADSASKKAEDLKNILARRLKGPTLKEGLQELTNDVGHFFGCVCILKADPLLNVNDKNDNWEGRQQEGTDGSVTEVTDGSVDENSTLGLSDGSDELLPEETANHLSSAVSPLVGAAESLLSKRSFGKSRGEHQALLESVAAKLTNASQMAEAAAAPTAGSSSSSLLKSAAFRLEQAAGGFRKISASACHSSNFNLPNEEHDIDAATVDAAYHAICGASSLLSKSTPSSSAHVIHLLKTAADLLQRPSGTSQLHGVSVIPPAKSTLPAASTKISSATTQQSGASAAALGPASLATPSAAAVLPNMAVPLSSTAVPAARTLLSSAVLLYREVV